MQMLGAFPPAADVNPRYAVLSGWRSQRAEGTGVQPVKLAHDVLGNSVPHLP
ncbi:MAG: hypothetical protein WCG47_25770 [Dermatophilaceae bacterium]